MKINKIINNTDSIVPLIAALPIEFSVEGGGYESEISYNSKEQRTLLSRGDYSTSREDESAWPALLTSKSDTKKDD